MAMSSSDGELGQDRIFDPDCGQVFVFGSNEAGIHGAGAARYAYKKLQARLHVGEGAMPDWTNPACYAIPTKDDRLSTLGLDRIATYVNRFIEYATSRPALTFFVTRIGCGLAGYEDKDIAPLFKGSPDNCILPYGWP